MSNFWGLFFKFTYIFFKNIMDQMGVQRVPALRVFWDLEKTVLNETRVSGTVLWSPTNASSPTYSLHVYKPKNVLVIFV